MSGIRLGLAYAYDQILCCPPIGILSALHERASSGKGQQIDVSLFDVGIISQFRASAAISISRWLGDAGRMDMPSLLEETRRPALARP